MEIKNEDKIPVGGFLDPTTPEKVLGSAASILDETTGKRQSEINSDNTEFEAHVDYRIIKTDGLEAIPFKFIAGETYHFTNEQVGYAATLLTRLTKDGEKVDLIGEVSSGNIKDFIPTTDANYLFVGNKIGAQAMEIKSWNDKTLMPTIYDHLSIINRSVFVPEFEIGGLDVLGNETNNKKRARNKGFITEKNILIRVPSDFLISAILYFDQNDPSVFKKHISVNDTRAVIGEKNCVARITIKLIDDSDISLDRLGQDRLTPIKSDIHNLENNLSLANINIADIKKDISYDKDMSSVIESGVLSITGNAGESAVITQKESKLWSCAKVSVTVGETYKITSHGANNACSYCLVDENNIIVLKSEPGTYVDKIIQITADGYLYSNADCEPPYPRHSLKKVIVGIADINYRLNSLMSSGQYLLLEYGYLENGLPKFAEKDTDFYKGVRTSLFFGINNHAEVNLKYDKGLYDAVYSWYDNNFIFLSSSTSNIPDDNSAFCKIAFTKKDGSNFDSLPKIQILGSHLIFKNSQIPLETVYYTFATTYNNGCYENSPLDEVRYGELAYDQMMLKLPPNYSVNGEPVRLAIFCHGSGAFQWGKGTFGEYNDLVNYVCNEGYAVMAVCGINNKNNNKYGTEITDNFGTPNAMNCYASAYNFVRRNFNIKEKCVAWGKSLGGMMVGNLATNNTGVPMLACAGLAPTLDIFSSTLRIRDKEERRYYAEQIGMEGDEIDFRNPGSMNYYNNVSQDVWNEYFKKNAWRSIGYNPIWNGDIGLNTDKLLNETYKHGAVSTGNEYPEERIAFESLPKVIPVPLKIWMAKDDVNVDPRFAEYMVEMAKKGGSYYRVRWMPNGTGQHNSVDTGREVDGVFQAPIKGDIVPRYSSLSVSIPVAYIEMINWFRHFE